jgi:transcriptional regulator with XRE-family HTH domain
MPDFAEKVGIRIQTLRAAKGISQTELARRINLTRPYLSRIERGRFNMRLDTMEEICRGLGVQPAELLEGIIL